ncbi:MAG: hypothetical protein [Podoviridae sp. ctKoA10]|nr:MAG: hypothetical protein [Podoviridae sp. ctKoA10]
MSGINEVKARISAAKDQVEFYNAVEDVCICGGFRFDDRETMKENSERAALAGRPLISEALRFAGAVVKRNGWSE